MGGDDLKPARAAALRYLKTRDRTVAQMREHLEKKEFSRTAIESTVSDFQEMGYLNDARFAERFIQHRMESRHWGRHRLADELRKRGISREQIQLALEEALAEVNESDLALTCAEKKMKSLSGLDTQTARRRLAQFLQRKGFSQDTVYQTLEALVPW
jgi:regulatory protein